MEYSTIRRRRSEPIPTTDKRERATSLEDRLRANKGRKMRKDSARIKHFVMQLKSFDNLHHTQIILRNLALIPLLHFDKASLAVIRQPNSNQLILLNTQEPNHLMA
jgi:hypothetical protein